MKSLRMRCIWGCTVKFGRIRKISSMQVKLKKHLKSMVSSIYLPLGLTDVVEEQPSH